MASNKQIYNSVSVAPGELRVIGANVADFVTLRQEAGNTTGVIRHYMTNSTGAKYYEVDVDFTANVVKHQIDLGSGNAVPFQISNLGNTQFNRPVTILTSSGPMLNLQDGGAFGSAADPHMYFSDGTTTNAVVGFDNSAQNIFRLKVLNGALLVFNMNGGDVGAWTNDSLVIGNASFDGYKLSAKKSASGTAVDAGAIMAARNLDSTNGNNAGLAFLNSTGASVGGVEGVFTNHNTVGTASGDIRFWTRDAGAAGEKIRITQSGALLIGTPTSAGTGPYIDFLRGSAGIINGAGHIRLADITTNAVGKQTAISLRNALNAEEDITILYASGGTVYFGGGVSALNAAAVLRFYTAADEVTLSGTEAMRIDQLQSLRIGATGVTSGWSTEKLTVYHPISSAGNTSHTGLATWLDVNGNTPYTGNSHQAGSFITRRNAVTANTADTVSLISAAYFRLRFSVDPGITYTNTGGTGMAAIYVAAPEVPSGTLAITHLSGAYIAGSSSASGTNKYGIFIDGQSGATNNWSLYTNGGDHRFRDNVRIGNITGVLSQTNEQLSVRRAVGAGDLAGGNLAGQFEYLNNNDAGTTAGSQVGIGAIMRRTITTSTSDGAGASYAGIASSWIFTVSAAQTYTNTSGAVATIRAAAPSLSGGGSLAISEFAGLAVASSSIATGARKVGLNIGTQTGGTTGNAAISNHWAFSGDWFINSDSSAPSTFGTSTVITNNSQVHVFKNISGTETSDNAGLSARITHNNNTAGASGIHRGIFASYRRQITATTTDTTFVQAGLEIETRLEPSATFTLNNSSFRGVTGLYIGGTTSGAGTLNVNALSRIFIDSDTAASGLRKAGMYLGAMSGATNNVAITDSLAFSGNYFILQLDTTRGSRFDGGLGIQGDASATNIVNFRKDQNALTRLIFRNTDVGAGATIRASLSAAPGDVNWSADSTAGGATWSLIGDSGYTGGGSMRQDGNNPLSLWTNGSNRINISGAGLVTIGTAAGTESHVVNGILSLIKGGVGSGNTGNILMTDTTSNTTTKSSGISLRHYNNAEENVGILAFESTSSTSILYLGTGGTTSQNAMTQIQFFTAATNTTTLGSLKGSVSSAGLWTIGAAAGTELHVVNGSLQITRAANFSVNGPGASNGISNPSSSDHLHFYTGSTDRGFLDQNGKWTFGATGYTGGHQFNAGEVLIYGDAPRLVIQDGGTFGSNADPVIHFKDGLGYTGATIGYTNAAQSNFRIQGNHGNIIFNLNGSDVGAWQAADNALVVGDASYNGYKLSVKRATAATTTAGASTIGLHNTDTTVNNMSTIAFVNASTASVAGIDGVNINHNTAGTATGELVFWTRNAGSLGERMRLNSSGALLVGSNVGFSLDSVGINTRISGVLDTSSTTLEQAGFDGGTYVNTNSAITAATKSGAWFRLYRTGSASVTDTNTKFSAVQASIGVVIGGGNTWTFAGALGAAAYRVIPPNQSTGSFALTHYAGLWVQAESINTGTNKYGVLVEDISGATNNWSVHTGTAKTSFGGAVAHRKGADFTSIAAAHSGTTVFPSANGYYRVTGSTAMTIHGIAAGVDGQVIRIWNNSGQNMTFADQSGTETVAANRIITNTGGSVNTTGDGFAELIYDVTASRWILMYISP